MNLLYPRLGLCCGYCWCPGKLLSLLDTKGTKGTLVDFDLSAGIDNVVELLRRYRNGPMSEADACFVGMNELRANCLIFSMDSDFNIYRRIGGQIIPTLLPESGI